MKLKTIQGKIINRYKRFFADVELPSKEVVVCHTTNTGPMKTCWEKYWPCAISPSDNPNRKLKFTLEMTFDGESWIGVNTHLANKLFAEALDLDLISELQGYSKKTPEVTIGSSRIDWLLENKNQKCYVEIKSVTYKNKDQAQFPDTVSERATKHLKELIKIKKSGDRAVLVLIIQRENISSFAPAKELDPVYASTFKEALEAGVEILAYKCHISPKEIIVKEKVPVEL